MLSQTFDRGAWRAGYGVAFLVAMLASGSILAARLAHGGLGAEWLGGTLLSVAAIGCAMAMDALGARRRNRGWFAGAQVLGAASAVGVVHLALVVSRGQVDAALVEGPRQLVNDAVLVAAILGLAWSVGAGSRALRVGLPVACVLLVALYDATASQWHLDAFSGLAVQKYVVHQCVGAAAALWIFDLLRPRPTLTGS